MSVVKRFQAKHFKYLSGEIEFVVCTLSAEEELLNRVVVNLKVMAGKPIIRGTRIPVELVLRLLAQGLSFEEILNDYPHLSL